jgi:hypothetical protein
MRIRIGLVASAALLASTLLCSCATIINGRFQTIKFDSTPPGATVHVDGYPEVRTPSSIDLWRKNSCVAVISKDGYREERVPINVDFNLVALLNVVSWSIPGVMIDAFDGAMGELKPPTVAVTLQEVSPQPAPSPAP